MPFVESILRHRSLSIVGLEKNTGKTVCLNYLLGRLHQLGVSVAVTSIGVDGEQADSVYATAKPEITLFESMQFVTSEQHYAQRRIVSQIIAVDERRTALGRLVTAQALSRGKVLLSGAATTALLQRQIADSRGRGIRLTVVDGALSRLSLASPTVTDAMILATGAAVSPSLPQLVSKTRFAFRLINLPETDPALRKSLGSTASGLWEVDGEGTPHSLGIASAFLLGSSPLHLSPDSRLFASGAVTDRLLKHLCSQPALRQTTLIVRDFTKLFITPEVYGEFTRRGGRIEVLRHSNLVAVCLNPTSPQGYRLNSAEACRTLSEALQTPVYDVVAGLNGAR